MANEIVKITNIQPSTVTDYYTVQYTTGSVYLNSPDSPIYLPYSSSYFNTTIGYGSTTIKVAPYGAGCTNSQSLSLPTANLSYSFSENGSVNGNLVIYAGDTLQFNSSTSGNFKLPESASIFFTLYNSGSISWPGGASMNVTASRDGVLFYSASTSVSGSILSGSFITANTSIYKIMATTKI